MARLFDDAQSEYLSIEQAVVSGCPLAVTCFFRQDALGINATLLVLCDKDDDDVYQWLVVIGADNKVHARTRTNGGVSTGAIATTACSVNTWYHGCGIWASATDRRAFLNGGSKGTDNTNSAPVGFDRTSIGAWTGSGGGLHFQSGKIAEVAVWDLSALPGATPSDKADYFETNVLPNLAAGKRPSVYPTGLIPYWPLVNDDNDYADDFDLTPYNTPSWATHPTILCLLTESATATDAENGLRILSAEITESATAVDEVSCTGIFLSTVTEAANATDVEDGSRTYLAEITEVVEATDVEDGYVSKTYISEIAEIADAADIQDSYLSYTEIPPFMHQNLIDPFAGGAWLWAVQIAIAGQDTVRIVRNTEDIRYRGKDFDKFNLQVGEQIFSGDGSIPRVTLRVFQDVNRIVEDLINATEGALGAQVQLIRVNEKFLTSPVSALEFDYDNLAAESDTEWCTFTLGIPNPLTQRFPLRDYSSSICPWTPPPLFKGPRCQYPGDDPTCTGTYEDCYTKGNAVHWGAELGLDSNVVRV